MTDSDDDIVFDDYIEEEFDEKTKQKMITTRTGKRIPAFVYHLAKNKAKANKHFILLAKISIVFEKHGWKMDGETFQKVVDEVVKEHTKGSKNRKEVEDLVALCYGQKFAGGDVPTRKALTSEALQHIRDGLTMALETGKFQIHQGYIDRYLRLLFPSLHLKGKMSEEEMSSFRVIESGDTRAIEGRNVSLSDILDGLKQVEVKKIENKQQRATTDVEIGSSGSDQ